MRLLIVTLPGKTGLKVFTAKRLIGKITSYVTQRETPFCFIWYMKVPSSQSASAAVQCLPVND
ncbi:hypothetical protein [Halopseudomonas xinjiangensis]|nr:hypothetical protein [Halopseudomonas xinjiangensis]